MLDILIYLFVILVVLVSIGAIIGMCQSTQKNTTSIQTTITYTDKDGIKQQHTIKTQVETPDTDNDL